MNILGKIRKFVVWTLICVFVSSISVVVLYRYVPVYVTPLMLIRCAQQVSRGEHIRLKHHWVELDDSVSLYMPIAVMASEDQRFLEHWGFDFVALRKVVKMRMDGDKRFGGSTISQQTAKNVFLWPAHSWARKGLEAYFTVLIEVFWGKHRIMEVYLNSIEMGDGIYGVDAVAWQHFGRPASRLTRSNCALIAATLPNPLRFSSKEPSPYMLRRQSWIMRHMRPIDPFPKKGGNEGETGKK